MSTKKEEKPVLFSVKFPEDLKTWCVEQKRQGKPGTQYAFAKQVGIGQDRVSDWKTGRGGIPYKYLPKICEVLGVSEDRYYPKTHAERYENSKNCITEIGKKNVDFAVEKGLDLDLVRVLSQIVDFDESFPVYAPINNIIGTTVCRSVNVDSAPIDRNLDYLQVEQDGKRITFHIADLTFLKEVQDQIVDYVGYLFYKRKHEMKREVDRFNEDLAKSDYKGDWIPEEFILEHDRFAYLFEDVKLPNPRQGRRKATQEDIDRFFGSRNDQGKVVNKTNGETITIKKEGK